MLRVISLKKQSDGVVHVYTYRDPTLEQIQAAANIADCVGKVQYFSEVTVETSDEDDRFFVSILE